MTNSTTIFALSTLRGKSALSVYRISGKESLNILKFITKSKLNFIHKQMVKIDILNSNGDVIDESIVCYFKAPNSFTGEDVVEIYTHGSIAVQNELEEEILSYGDVRYAQRGEFTRRAVLNSKMNLTQAEGLNDLINSETRLQKKQAMNSLKGKFYSELESLKPSLLRVMALLEAYIDFPDEDIPEDTLLDISNIIESSKKVISKFLSNKNKGERLRAGLKLVIYGKPNTGKSSLINYLTKRKVSIVSDISGTTRDSIETHIEIDGYPIILVDTAGLKDSTDDLIEKEGIKIARQHLEDADIKIFIQSLDQTNKENIEFSNDEYTINMINKSDEEKFEDSRFLNVSINTGEGLDKLNETVINLARELAGNGDEAVVTRKRQKFALINALESLNRFDVNYDIVLAAEDVRICIRQLSSLFGKIDIEEVLDNIFSEFCIGK